jgi:hypothetical protein
MIRVALATAIAVALLLAPGPTPAEVASPEDQIADAVSDHLKAAELGLLEILRQRNADSLLIDHLGAEIATARLLREEIGVLLELHNYIDPAQPLYAVRPPPAPARPR